MLGDKRQQPSRLLPAKSSSVNDMIMAWCLMMLVVLRGSCTNRQQNGLVAAEGCEAGGEGE